MASEEKALIPAVGTFERALHDQWVSFALTELDAWCWHTFMYERRVPESERSDSVTQMNGAMWKK